MPCRVDLDGLQALLAGDRQAQPVEVLPHAEHAEEHSRARSTSR